MKGQSSLEFLLALAGLLGFLLLAWQAQHHLATGAQDYNEDVHAYVSASACATYVHALYLHPAEGAPQGAFLCRAERGGIVAVYASSSARVMPVFPRALARQNGAVMVRRELHYR